MYANCASRFKRVLQILCRSRGNQTHKFSLNERWYNKHISWSFFPRGNRCRRSHWMTTTGLSLSWPSLYLSCLCCLSSYCCVVSVVQDEQRRLNWKLPGWTHLLVVTWFLFFSLRRLNSQKEWIFSYFSHF